MRGLRRWGPLVVAVAGSLVVLAVLTALLMPPLRSALAAETVEDRRAFVVEASGEASAGASVDPSADSSVEVTPPLGWSVQPAVGGGLLVISPDRLFAVTIAPCTAAEAEAALEAELQARRPQGGAVLVETLENGAEVRHVASERRELVELSVGEGVVLVDAEARQGARLGDYRVALSELLLEIRPAG